MDRIYLIWLYTEFGLVESLPKRRFEAERIGGAAYEAWLEQGGDLFEARDFPSKRAAFDYVAMMERSNLWSSEDAELIRTRLTVLP